jgi:hypothetical protein
MHTNFSTAGLGVVRRWHIAKPSTNRIRISFATSSHLTLISFPALDPDPNRHVYTKLSLSFSFADSAARPTDDHDNGRSLFTIPGESRWANAFNLLLVVPGET